MRVKQLPNLDAKSAVKMRDRVRVLEEEEGK